MSGAGIDGYSGKPLWQKLGLKPGLAIRLENPPRDYADLVGLPAAELDVVGPRAGFDLAHVFATKRSDLEACVERVSHRLPSDGVLWISWPKKSSKLASDITEDTIRLIALPRGLVDIKVCAVDSIWSGLKLVWRKELRASKIGFQP
jgi:hypothetical protein